MNQDIRSGLILLAKSPTFTIVAVLTLALGIGATSSIFSIMNAAMLQPLPYPDPDRLMQVVEVRTTDGARRNPNTATVVAWDEEALLFDGIAGSSNGQLDFQISGERIRYGLIYLDTLSLLGVRPLLGRWYEPDEVMSGQWASTIVISYGMWQRHFGGDPEVIGKSLPDWDADWGVTVIGVMPPGFWVSPDGVDLDGWYAGDRRRLPPVSRGVLAIARPKAGVSLEQAEAELTAISLGLAEDDTAAREWEVELEPLRDVISRGYAQTLFFLMGGAGFVLLIACVNVVNLQLSRNVARETEMATRSALGASRLRLLRQLVIENLVLAVAGGSLGVLVAVSGTRIFVLLAPDFYPPTQEIRLDSTVLLFTFGISVLSGLLFGLIPALRASRIDLHTTLNESFRGTRTTRQYLRRALVIAEVALAFVLLVGAGLMFNSYLRMQRFDKGFETDNLVTMEISLVGLNRYRIVHNFLNHAEILPEHDTFFRETLDRIAALPDVEMVGMTSALPPSTGPSFPVAVVGGPEGAPLEAAYHEISRDYLETMGITLLRGRSFTDLDTGSSPAVTIINQTAAERLFPGEDPIGQLLQATMNGSNPALEGDRRREVVGVVDDIRAFPRQAETFPTIYIPYTQHLRNYAGVPSSFPTAQKQFVIRTSRTDVAGLANAIRAAVAEVDRVPAVDAIMPMAQRLSLAGRYEQFLTQMLGTFAGLGVFLAAMGIYGVIAYSVAQRTHEFGIRTALGARRSDISGIVIRDGLTVTAIGIGLGLAASFGLTRLLQTQLPLYEITPMDPPTLAVVGLTLLVVALAACYVPARQVSSQNPLEALRVE